MLNNQQIEQAMRVKLKDIFPVLPEYPSFAEGIRRAPKREFTLNQNEVELALKNALRYVPEEWHEQLAAEFLEELMTKGRIYAYRFRPQGNIKGLPIDAYKGKTVEARAFQVMIDNNLDFDIALYPYELVTYGESGQIFQNWMQYWLIKAYLEIMTEDQTLVIDSGNPRGLFKSSPEAPRCIITNGLMIGMFDNPKDFGRAAALGVANYGQMTAGGWMYIGPQGIVHGTYSTILNAGRRKQGLANDADLKGQLFITSGLGGMSGAQGKAAEIANGVAIVAEVDESRIITRHSQGWVSSVAKTPAEAFDIAEKYKALGEGHAIAFHGNIVDLLEYALENNRSIDLLSDQTSCHAVYEGGYCPSGITFEERTRLLAEDKVQFCKLVDETLKKHYQVIKALVAKGVYFFDYGNAFMKAVYDAGVTEICKNGVNELDGFVFPSYVEDILGPLLFDYGYGPFRWVCLSGSDEDLRKTDHAAMAAIDPNRRFQDMDNYIWIRDAEKNKLVVGTKARILYQDALGRMNIALKFNEMVRKGEIGPVMLGRDHHDTGGTDSPFRETSNIYDGSNIMAEMATQSFAGDAARGMSLIALHNGGGVGVSKSINGGFGLVLDGSLRVDNIIQRAIPWDVMNGVSRRAWARNENSISTCVEYNNIRNGADFISLPYLTNESLVSEEVQKAWAKYMK